MERTKRMMLLSFVMFAINISTALAAERAERTTANQHDWQPVIEAIIEVESGGNARAKSGQSVGAMQITPLLVADCNMILQKRKSKKRFKLSDRFSVKKSKEMFLLIQSWYNPEGCVEKAIRSWNGGIHYTVAGTQRYFEKVMKALKGKNN